ncbi:ribosome silencing factor [Raineyella sp. LH-20]|uniref:ribosome silencing factor n=1 Tax=Raineyella sp. LH-20 TaxID=3081204 RepID=UPI002954BBE1|nr:ribosome silencing factor [Raineyella sp. LH-20]WOP17698.1 ribosome silencing factor [Raineyella sp. LH-20]
MTATERSVHLARVAAQAAADKLATNLVAFDVSEQLAITDIFLVATAANDRQVGAVVDAIEEALHREDVKRTRIEGDRDQRWVLVDFLDLVVHVMQPDERALYALERLWGDCPRVELAVEETR